MLKPFWVDLHIHTALSPCGSLEMGAPEIVSAARKAGIDVIGIADHNTCDNCQAVYEAAEGDPVVLPCIETQSAEDIHILSVFPDLKTAMDYKEWLWQKIMPIKNDVDYFGYQVVLDHCNNILREEETLLIQGSGYEVDQIVSKVQELGGIAILFPIPLHWGQCRPTTLPTPLSSRGGQIRNRQQSGGKITPEGSS